MNFGINTSGLAYRLTRQSQTAGRGGPRVPDRLASGRPLTDREHAEHVADVRSRLADAHRAGLATHVRHTIDRKRRIWTDERAAVHNALVADLYAAASGGPCEYKAVVAGGLGGAGKTTVLVHHAGIDLTHFLVINPDNIKEEMARRGLIPHVDCLSPMEASDLVHEESSLIAKRLAHQAQADGKNVIWDVTMSKNDSTTMRIESLRSAGYTHVAGIFVDIPVEVSVRRADVRHREGHDAYRAGDGLGGRYLPPEVTRSLADDVWGSKNRRNFEQVKVRFDAWLVYDNSVDHQDPVVVQYNTTHRADRRITVR